MPLAEARSDRCWRRFATRHNRLSKPKRPFGFNLADYINRRRNPKGAAIFKELLPRESLLLGTLAQTDSINSLIALFDSGVVRMRGTGTVGDKYHIRAGKIDGAALSMVQDEIVI